LELIAYKNVAELGLLIVIATTFIRQQQKLFAQQDKVISVLAKLEKNLNTDILRGQALEQCLILKIQEMRWGVQKKVINYIERNHLQKNWDIIIREIDTYFNSKFVEFDDDMRNIIENSTFKIVKTILYEEFTELKHLLIQLLDSLRVEGTEDKEMYITAKRIVEEHMNDVENQIKSKIKEII
jgi:hypothetical protein